MFKHLKNFDDDKGDLLHWIRKIHIHCALDFLKDRKVFAGEVDESIILRDIYSIAQEKFEAQYILKFIEDLGPRDRVIFNMHQIEGYSHEEIADMLSINVNSSRVYLARAKKTLREKITAFHGRISLVR